MGFADVWSRTLVYFGIAEEDDWDEDGYATNEELERSYGARERANVRRLQPRRGRDFDDWTDSEPAVDERPRCAAASAPARRRGGAEPGSVKVHLILPRSFNDAQQIADRFKDGVPVILNLQSADQDLSKRLIDFASGLTYALDGGMQRVADKVFLLRRATSRSPPRNARECSNAAASSTKPSGRREPVGKPFGRRTKRHGRPSRRSGLLADLGSSLASFVARLHLGLHPAALRVHPDVLDPAAVPTRG